MPWLRPELGCATEEAKRVVKESETVIENVGRSGPATARAATVPSCRTRSSSPTVRPTSRRPCTRLATEQAPETWRARRSRIDSGTWHS